MRLNISNRAAYTFIVLGVIALVAISVNALTPGVAPNPGHTIDSVAPPSPCSAGYFLQFDGTDWVCTPAQGQITNGLLACSGADLSIKTINPATGAVTCETDDAGSSSGGGISGSGTTDYIPKFTASDTIANSKIYQDPSTGMIGIGTTNPLKELEIINDFNIDNTDGQNTDLEFLINDNNVLAVFNVENDNVPDQRNWLYINRDWGGGLGYHSDFTDVLIYGNVGVNQTYPDEALEVTGNLKINSGDIRSNGNVVIHLGT